MKGCSQTFTDPTKSMDLWAQSEADSLSGTDVLEDDRDKKNPSSGTCTMSGLIQELVKRPNGAYVSRAAALLP